MLAGDLKRMDEGAFDSATEALMWAGYSQELRAEGTRDRMRTASSRSFHCDDVFIVLRRLQMQGKLTDDHMKVAHYFIKSHNLPGKKHRKYVHKLWDEVIEAVTPELQRKGIVYVSA